MRENILIYTHCGKKIDINNLKPEDICIEDIAHSLSLLCRYGGHIREFYSVAEHSVLVQYYLKRKYNSKKLALCGLLHDAAEAYFGDVISPIKKRLSEYRELEDACLGKILVRFRLFDEFFENKDLIHKADKEVQKAEMGFFYRKTKALEIEDVFYTKYLLSSRDARNLFLIIYDALCSNS